jgi:hypothetical protein
MIKFEDENLGKVVIRFRHTLPSVTVPNQNNSLVSILNGIKVNQGKTECTINIDCDDSNSPMYMFFGTAHTHPSDHYKKETGRVLALNRAVASMMAFDLFNEADGRAVMAGYYSR